KVCEADAAATRAFVRSAVDPTELLAAPSIGDREDIANFGADQDHQTALGTYRKHQFTVAIAARTALAGKLPSWRVWRNDIHDVASQDSERPSRSSGFFSYFIGIDVTGSCTGAAARRRPTTRT